MRSTWNFAAGVFLLSASLAFAAGNPTLEVQSPAQNATVPGNAVKIEFRVRDFKIVSLKNMVVPGARAAGAASSSDDSGSPMSASQSSAPGQALGGMSPNYSGSTASGAGNNPVETGSGSAAPQPGSASPSVNPREGFLVAKVDDSPYFIFHTTNDPIMLVFQQPGQHRVILQLMTDDARPTGQPQSLSFTTGGAAAPAAPQK
jgi:hypothetical protein